MTRPCLCLLLLSAASATPNQAEARVTRCGRVVGDRTWQEELYNAAICFEAAGRISMAISLRLALVKKDPHHPLARKSLYMVGASYQALVWYDRAADNYEAFARRFPKEPEAPQALKNAIAFRLGRGEYDQAIEDARLFAKNYGGRRRRYAAQTAAVIFSLGQIHEQRKDYEAIIRHYKRYLRDWGNRGGIDRRILAHVRIGEALWISACPIATVDGACVRIERERSKRRIKRWRRQTSSQHLRARLLSRTQCGSATAARVTVVLREALKTRIAMRHFDEALTLFRRLRAGKIKGDNSEQSARRTQEMRSAAASARFYQADKALEDFLAVAFPRRLDFSNPRRRVLAERRFGRYLSRKAGALLRARRCYQDVIGFKVAHWAIAGAARIGQLYQHFSGALYTARIPQPAAARALRSSSRSASSAAREELRVLFIDSYCDALEEKAAPLERRAIQAFAVCVEKAAGLSWYNAWSRLCEEELNQLSPTSYPLATEIRAEPGFVNVAAARAGLIGRLKK